MEEQQSKQEQPAQEQKEPQIQQEHQKNNTKTNESKSETVDFRKIKHLFSKKKTEIKNNSNAEKDSSEKKENKKNNDSSDQINLKAVLDFFVKHRAFFIILIPIFLAIFLRIQTDSLPMADDWASNSINDFYKNQVAQQVNMQYPNLPPQNKQVIIAQEYDKFYQQNKDRLQQEIASTADYFRSQFKNDDGVTYLIGIDPWYYYRNAKNYIEHGYEGDKIINGEYVDTKVYGGLPDERRRGSKSTINLFHTAFIIYTFKLVKLFNSNATLLGVTFYIPVILAALAVIPVFFIGRKFGGNLGGFIAATIVAVHRSLLVRSVGGFSDNDLYSVLFPALVVWIFIEAYESDTWLKRTLLTILCGATIGLYAFAWIGWWFIVYFIFGTIGLILLYNMIVNRDQIKQFTAQNIKKFLAIESIKKAYLTLAILLLTVIIFVPLIATTRDLTNAITGPYDVIHFKDVGTTTLWPNVFTTVAEQNALSLVEVISEAGGKLFLFLAFLGIVFSITPNIKKEKLFVLGASIWFLLLAIFHDKFNGNLMTYMILISLLFVVRIIYDMYHKDKETNILHAVLLTAWLIGTLYASVFAVRYVLLFIVPFAIALGYAIGILVKEVSEWLAKTLEIKKVFVFSIIGLLSLLIVLTPVKESYNIAFHSGFVDMNDQWYNTLTKIKLNSKENAVVNSWWDFGHWFKAITERAVTLDGGNQNRPQAHWLGKVLLTNDEKQATAILKMLDCGANLAFDDLNLYEKDEYKTKQIIDKIILLDPEKAKLEMKKENIPDEVIQNVSRFSFCEGKETPEDFFITSDDMVGKAGVWAHFGAWNFTRAKIVDLANNNEKQEALQFMTEKLGFTQEQANQVYLEVKPLGSGPAANTWIAPWPSYYSGFTPCSATNTAINCQNGVSLNLSSGDVTITQNNNKIFYPKKASYINAKGEFVVKNYDKDLLISQNGEPMGISIVPAQNGGFNMILMHPQLVDSMFNRLFFYSGHGLKCFDNFDTVKTTSGGNVLTWKIDWTCSNATIVYNVVPPVKPAAKQ